MKLDDSTEITEIKIIDIDTGKEYIPSEKPDRKQHFINTFQFNNYHIQLRLDWSDIRNGEPTLDADIWIQNKNKKESIKKGPWHHTEKKFEKKIMYYVYKFKFENFELTLITKIANTLNLDGKIKIIKNNN